MEAGQKILIVEDNKNSLSLMVKLLSKSGVFQFVTAGNGFEALISLQSESGIKVIVVDWEMPEMNGIDFLETVKSMDGVSKIPVIMQTAKDDRAHHIKAIRAGAFAYVYKPIDFDLLEAYLFSAIKHCYPA